MEGISRLGTKRRIAVAIAAGLLLVATPARAASIDDPDNARGPLDLKRLEAHKHDATAPVRLRVVTYGSWDASLLDVSGGNRIFILFNSDSSGRPEFIGEVLFRDGRLRMRITTGNGQFVRRVRVYHPTGNSIRTRVPRGLPNPDGNVWLAAREEYVTATGPCAATCDDRIPNKGWMKLTPGL